RRVEPDDRALPEAAAEAHGSGDRRRTETADLAVGRKPDADVLALLAQIGLLLAEAGVVQDLQCLVERGDVVAGVVRQPGRDRVPVGEGREEVLLPAVA